MKLNALFFVVAALGATGNLQAQKNSAPVVPTPAAISSSAWEISGGVLFQELNMQWDTKVDPISGPLALKRKEKDSQVSPSVSIARKVAQIKSTQLLLSLGWSRGEASWESGEFEAGEGPDELYTSNISSFEVSVNRFLLGMDARIPLGGGFSAGIVAGPTLTLVKGDFFGTQERFQHVVEGELGVFRSGSKASASGTELAFGVMGSGYLRYSFPGDHVFLQASGGYNWGQDVHFGSSQIGANFDPSTWAAGVSLGFRF